jgi:hypothetical protein
MFTVIARFNNQALSSFECDTLVKAKAWGKEKLFLFGSYNNASIFSDDYNFKTLHASYTKGRVVWKSSKF